MNHGAFDKADELVELIHQNVNIFGVYHIALVPYRPLPHWGRS
jgi:hypothetical protein